MINQTASTCRSCGAEIVWVTTPAGKQMPLDPHVLTVVADGGETVRGRVSHFASCPNAAAHRKRKEVDA